MEQFYIVELACGLMDIVPGEWLEESGEGGWIVRWPSGVQSRAEFEMLLRTHCQPYGNWMNVQCKSIIAEVGDNYEDAERDLLFMLGRDSDDDARSGDEMEINWDSDEWDMEVEILAAGRRVGNEVQINNGQDNSDESTISDDSGFANGLDDNDMS